MVCAPYTKQSASLTVRAHIHRTRVFLLSIFAHPTMQPINEMVHGI